MSIAPEVLMAKQQACAHAHIAGNARIADMPTGEPNTYMITFSMMCRDCAAPMGFEVGRAVTPDVVAVGHFVVGA